jgi:hypothetical protein
LGDVNDMASDFSFLADQLADCETHWSLGTFGALAEFTRGVDEPVAMTRTTGALSTVTARGGISFMPRPDLRLFASEGVTKTSWSHRVALCLPETSCNMNRRRVLTELGPDRDALREQDHDAILFDLGFHAMQVDACIRVADKSVAADLRAHTGRPVLEHGNPAMGIILMASPHRVFVSRLGRIEVFAKIPPPNGKSPEGPHTHVLPKLLRHKRTHSATEPVPENYLPCAHLYPAHPVKDSLGRERAYDSRRHDHFQDILRRFGDPNAVALKQRIASAIRQGDDPAQMRIPNDRFARTGIRVALRQMQAAREESTALDAWIEHFDRAQSLHSDIDDEIHTEVSHAPS